MNYYTKKKRWKWVLFTVAVIIVTGSLWYTNILVKKIARSERNNVRIWADAIQRKANLVAYTETFFEQIREEERKRAEKRRYKAPKASWFEKASGSEVVGAVVLRAAETRAS